MKTIQLANTWLHAFHETIATKTLENTQYRESRITEMSQWTTIVYITLLQDIGMWGVNISGDGQVTILTLLRSDLREWSDKLDSSELLNIDIIIAQDYGQHYDHVNLLKRSRERKTNS